jgi:hypothetical protein
MRAVVVVACLLLALASGAAASDVDLSRLSGHPRTRLPLALHIAPSGDASLDAAARKALSDWNALGRAALGTPVFTSVDRRDADVLVTVEPTDPPGLMGVALVNTDSAGVVALPVGIMVAPPRARGQTPADVIFYQVLAHELGHALGLPHASDARSVMCCARGAVDFQDPAQRDAYIASRRHPDLRSVEKQLADHYARFWK